MILHARSVLLLVTVPLMSAVEGYASRRNLIPNAYSSEYSQNQIDNVGHTGGFRYSLHAAGLMWTLALCQADDDSDGQSNGLEVGDPCCTWAQGTVAQFTTDLSYPGEAISKTSRSMPTCCTPSSTSPNCRPPQPRPRRHPHPRCHLRCSCRHRQASLQCSGHHRHRYPQPLLRPYRYPRSFGRPPRRRRLSAGLQ